MSESTITKQDLEGVAALYDGIRAIYKQRSPQMDANLHDAFEKYIKQVLSDLNQKAANQPKSIVDVLVLVTKFKLYQLCAQKIASFVKMLNPDAASILGELFVKQEQMYTEIAQRLIAAGRRAEDFESERDSARKETEEVLLAAETLEKTLISTQADRDRCRDEVARLKSEYVEQVEQLQEENKLFLEKIIKLSKQNAESAITFQSPAKSERKESKPQTVKSLSPGTQHTPPPKDLTLRQLKDFIDEIYASKPRMDQKSTDAQQPRETMEQHMMSTLNKKYGLKTLVAEWSANLSKAIQRFASEDSEVAAFAHILKNEVEEDFRNTQKQLKTSVGELLKMHIRTTCPYMQEKACKEWLAEKMNGELEDEEWEHVVGYLYSGQEAEYFRNALTQVVRTKDGLSPRRSDSYRQRRGKRTEDPQSKSRVTYQELIKILLDYQLEGHVKYLEPFAEKFKAVDEDSDGILTEGQFKALTVSLGLVESGERLLEAVDPFETNVISFSDCVSLFTAVKVTQEQVEDGPGRTTSLLQKLHGSSPSS